MINMSSNENQKGENKQQEEEKKTVTVRGVDEELYKKAVVTAKQTGKTVGEVINQALKNFFTVTESATRTVTTAVSHVTETGKAFIEGFKEAGKDVVEVADIEELTIDKEELIGIGKPVSFRNVKRLVLRNVTQEDVDKYIYSIVGVDEIVIPPTVNKLKLLQKCRLVKKITVST